MDEMPADALTLPAPASAPVAGDERRRGPDRPRRGRGRGAPPWPRSRRATPGRPPARRRQRRAGLRLRGLRRGDLRPPRRMLGDRAAAEDVQQQVFTEVWRRAGDYDARRAGLLTWVLTSRA